MKKFYATPTFEVVVLNMSDTICTSDGAAKSLSGEDNTLELNGKGTGFNRANNRNDIWGDE